jgi:rubrerythrin
VNIIFKVIVDALLKKSDKEARERKLQSGPAEAGDQAAESRRCPVCKAAAGEHDTECPSCGARLD